MSRQELKEFLIAMERLRLANTASPEKARQFLKEEGFLADDGTIAEPYKSSSRQLHKLSSSFVLGYHGCDRAVGEKLIGGTSFNASENEWDWLGSGAYFWEANPLRGLEFAQLLQRWRKATAHTDQINEPYVVGAVIDLGFCLDLTSSTGVEAVVSAYQDFIQYCSTAGVSTPRNEGGADSLFRELDCAVINHLHGIRRATSMPPFDSVKGVFIEGGEIYPGSGFHRKTHSQICVRNLACIRGIFRVPDDQLSP